MTTQCSGTPLAPRPMMDSHSITRCGCSIPLIGTRSAGSCAPLTGFVGVLERHHSVSRVPRSGRRIKKKLDPLLASPMSQPSPSGGEFGRLTAIHLRLVVTGLRHIEESFELFELL